MPSPITLLPYIHVTSVPFPVAAVGDTDGLIKGKRYFTCPPKHGKVVRITNIVAVLPNKVSYMCYCTTSYKDNCTVNTGITGC